MRISHQVFLAVAQELSFSKAASQLYITQQCASDHIRRLEKETGVKLFERKPKFCLTEAGRIMQQSLLNMKIIEASMERNLEHIARGEMGSFTVGISTSRAPIILPEVLPEYYQDYPMVNVSFNEADTQVLEEYLRQRRLDLFVGVNTTPHPDMEIVTLTTDEIMLVVSEQLLSRYFAAGEIEAMGIEGVDLRNLHQIPFVLPDFKTGKVNHVIQEYLNSHNVQLNMIYNISGSETQIMLCASGICAALCPKILLGAARKHNHFCSEGERLCVFSVKELERLQIDLVTHKRVVYPIYVDRFMELLRLQVPHINPFGEEE